MSIIRGWDNLNSYDILEERETFWEELKSNTTLKTFNLNRTQVDDREEVGLIGETLKLNTNLTNLYFVHVNLGGPRLDIIRQSLMLNWVLQTLYLKSCNIGVEGAVGLGNLLVANASLLDLD